jgi:hypothetical protein
MEDMKLRDQKTHGKYHQYGTPEPEEAKGLLQKPRDVTEMNQQCYFSEASSVK